MYKRILLKLSGELLMGDRDFGIDVEAASRLANELVEISDLGIELVVEIGGGNIYRWRTAQKGVKRNVADTMGMLGSIMNALSLRNAMPQEKEVRALSPVYMPYIIQYYTPAKAIHYLEEKRIVILGGGTGSQFFTTDTGAALHALQTGCEILLKGTNVEGVYSADPKIDPKAKKFDFLSFDEVISKKLKVMDITAFSLCQENNLPILVFNAAKKENIKKAAKGERIGTLIR